MDGNNEQNSVCCCQPLIRENDNIKKMKPILIVGIVIYVIVGCLDTFYLKNIFFLSYIAIVVFLCLMVFNGCFILFQVYTVFSIILLFQNIISTFGVPLQTKFKSPNAIGAFIIHIITFIFYFVYFYFCFKTYKEMKYVFLNNMANGPQLSSNLVQGNESSNYYYNNNNNNNISNNNNTPSSSSKGFKAFSGKGYAVGGS